MSTENPEQRRRDEADEADRADQAGGTRYDPADERRVDPAETRTDRRGLDRDGDGDVDRDDLRAGRRGDVDRDDRRTERTTTTAYDRDGRTGDPAYAAGGAAAVPTAPVAAGAARGRLHVGINWGAAFFGWVAAMGLAVILTAFIAAVGAAVGVTQGTTTVDQATSQLQNQDPQTVGIVGLVLLAVIAFVSYYGGGYVAARMSRFDGARQGFAVWLWAVIVAVVVAVIAAVAGARFDVLSTLNTFPRLPVNQGNLTSTGVVALVALLVITLLGAVVGGLGGMRYHRKLEAAEADLVNERAVRETR